MNLAQKVRHQPAWSPTSLEMRQIAQKWELFVSGTEVDLTDLSPVIREAWVRSKKAGVDPALPHAPLHLDSKRPGNPAPGGRLVVVCR